MSSLFMRLERNILLKKNHLYMNKYYATILIDPDYAFLPYTIRQDNIKRGESPFF